MTETEYIKRVTIAVPESFIEEANQLSLVLGESASDDLTFTVARYKDSYGNKYALCSTVSKEIFVQKATHRLRVPTHAPDVDIEKATKAQNMLKIGSYQFPEQASPDHIAAILGDRLESTQKHVEALGIELDEPNTRRSQ